VRKLFLALAVLFGMVVGAEAAAQKGDQMVEGLFSVTFNSVDVDEDDIDDDDLDHTMLFTSVRYTYFVTDAIEVGGAVTAMQIYMEDADAGTIGGEVLGKYNFVIEGTPVVPYAGAKIGFLNMSYEVDGDDESETGFSAGLMLGARYFFRENAYVLFEYDFLWTSMEFDDVDVDLLQHMFMVGLGFKF
jgi:opacity protein-like surface antigen